MTSKSQRGVNAILEWYAAKLDLVNETEIELFSIWQILALSKIETWKILDKHKIRICETLKIHGVSTQSVR